MDMLPENLGSGGFMFPSRHPTGTPVRKGPNKRVSGGGKRHRNDAAADFTGAA
jgi:hypothetical protein